MMESYVNDEPVKVKRSISRRLVLMGVILVLGLVVVTMFLGSPIGAIQFIYQQNRKDNCTCDQGDQSEMYYSTSLQKFTTDTLLAKNVTINENMTGVVLMAQMRGGSSFLSNIFMQNPDVCFWFEPAQSIYNHIFGHMANLSPDEIQLVKAGQLRNPSEYEIIWMTTYLTEMLSGHVENLPRDMFYDPMIVTYVDPNRKPFRDCVRSVKGQSQFGSCGQVAPRLYLDCYRWNGTIVNNGRVVNNSTRCQMVEDLLKCKRKAVKKFMKKMPPICERHIHDFTAKCAKKSISAMKLIRIRLSYTINLIKVNPNLKIIHYVRDPRGILSSRLKAKAAHMNPPSWADGKWNIYAAGLCTRMLDDVKSANIIKKMYPNNIITLRYEDLAAEPMKYAEILYKFIGHTIPNIVKDKLKKSTSAERDWGKFHTTRKDSKATSVAWKKKLPPDQIKSFTRACKQVLIQYHYDM